MDFFYGIKKSMWIYIFWVSYHNSYGNVSISIFTAKCSLVLNNLSIVVPAKFLKGYRLNLSAAKQCFIRNQWCSLAMEQFDWIISRFGSLLRSRFSWTQHVLWNRCSGPMIAIRPVLRPDNCYQTGAMARWLLSDRCTVPMIVIRPVNRPDDCSHTGALT